MTTEIKYRAWDDDNERFLYWEVGNIQDPFWDIVRIHVYSTSQYTGRKDKNEKEIYEGDICDIDIWNGQTGESMHFRVEIGELFKGSFTIRGSDEFFNSTSNKMFLSELSDEDEINIIGNLHGNPELLEEKK